jgi:hypothetical protein
LKSYLAMILLHLDRSRGLLRRVPVGHLHRLSRTSPRGLLSRGPVGHLHRLSRTRLLLGLWVLCERCSNRVCELLWLKIQLKELGYDSKDFMRLYCDNKVEISIAHNPVQHDWTKHIKIDWHFIKEKLRVSIICTSYVKTAELLLIF